MKHKEDIYEVIIVGSGFGGIGAAVYLQKHGIEDFLMLERDKGLGGTWYQNTYPGAAVDVKSLLYSLSFEPYDWSEAFAKQEEILAYTQHVISKYEIDKKALTQANVEGLYYEEITGTWTVEVSGNRKFKARNVINASGGLSQPFIPTIDGLDNFEGQIMHSSRWDHSYDYQNKRVAVVGSGASAVQLIPALSKKVKALHVFQRTPHWVTPRPDKTLSNFTRKMRKQFPRFTQFKRKLLYGQMEGRVIAFRYFNGLLKLGPGNLARRQLRKQIPDETLRNQLTPNYAIGCKRILLSSNYYPTFTKSHVTLHTKTSAIQSVEGKTIHTIDGKEIAVDLLVFATGFNVTENNLPYDIIGKNGLSIHKYWGINAHAYLGTTIPNFPNFYMIAGPNTGTGHTSAIHLIESQLIYATNLIVEKIKNKWKSIEIKEDVEKAYNKQIQEDLKHTVWQKGGCQSWYLNSEGLNTTLYPNFTFRFRKECKRFNIEAYHIN